jgi:hypothetical protein
MPTTEHVLALYERWIELRDQGVRMADAWRQLEISETAGRRYERSYRQLRGLPPGKPQPYRWK